MKSAAEWLINDNTYVTCVLALLMDKWGTDFFDWDPLTINLQVRDEFSTEATETLMDKIGAGSALFTTNTFFNDFETFNMQCNVMNKGVASSQYTMLADLDDIIWGITEARLLLGPIFKDEEFSDEIADYVGIVLSEAGFNNVPDVLKFANLPEHSQQYTDENLLKDDEMHLAYWQSQDENKHSIQEFNKNMLLDLFDQIEALPLKTINNDWFLRFRKSLTGSVL
jgi:hypothetical protein